MLVLVITIIAVSADAYIAGLSLTDLGRLPLLKIFYTAAFTWVLCTIFSLTVSLISVVAADVLKLISASILIVVGAKNLIATNMRDRRLTRKDIWTVSALTAVGLSVAIDAAVATVSLVGIATDVLAVPLCMFAAHYLFLWAGSQTAKLLNFVCAITKISGLFLIVLGLARLVG